MMANELEAMGATDRETLAAEIALGLVSAQEAAAATARDPELAAEIARWQGRFNSLVADAPPITPNPRTLPGILDLIEAETAVTTPPINAPATGLFEKLAFWRGLSAVGFAAAAAAIAWAVLITPEAIDPGRQQQAAGGAPVVERVILVNSILPRDGPPVYVVTFDQQAARLLVVPAATQASRSGVPYLWLVPEGDGEPVGLGVVNPSQTSRLDLSPDVLRRMTIRSSLVVTLEPSEVVNQSAAGPVLAHGKFIQL
jgi:anti-sigma-K factor RskA